jgi:peptidoglycan/LPS O-acetylase OafA/YrhL
VLLAAGLVVRGNMIKYRADIDGLRAIAVLPVVLFHSGFSLFGGGYVGVDAFFVISGYLITKLIVAARGLGGFRGQRPLVGPDVF